MEIKTIVHMLIYHALLDIRAASYENKGSKGIFKLADLFHNIPLRLNKISNEEEYEALLLELRKKAQLKGCDSWLENAIKQITTR